MVIFPDPRKAGEGEYICAGGNLEPETLISAYAQGIFPWYSEGDPIIWHCPHPRCVLMPENFAVSARSRRKIRNSSFTATINTAFPDVIAACAAPRKEGGGTWILPEMREAYNRLHDLGYAHSVEIWQGGSLAGGLYGVALGQVFFGESMFRNASEGSRAALSVLAALLQMHGFRLLDCQQDSPHMLAMGAANMPRAAFLRLLRKYIKSLAPTPLAGLCGAISFGGHIKGGI